MKNKNFEDLLSLVHSLRATQQEAAVESLPSLKLEVHEIISLGNEDKKRIERSLDLLLDLAYDERILVLFKQLCRHYYAIDAEASCFYVQSYRELWDTESLNDDSGEEK